MKNLLTALLVLLGALSGYTLGKDLADHWYAKHWHPNVRLSDVTEESKMNKGTFQLERGFPPYAAR